jgi:hypothetical protein
MRALFKLAFTWCLGWMVLGPVVLSGQEGVGGLAYLRFVNATGLPGKLFVTLDGEDINPEGYSDGFATGAVGFPAKICQVEFKHDGLGKVKVPVEIKAGEVTAVVALPIAEESKKEGEPPEIKLGHQVVASKKHQNGQPSTITVVQSSPAELLNFTVGGVPVAAAKLKPVVAPLNRGMGDFVAVKLGEKTLTTVNCTDPTDHVLFFFTDQKGVLKNVAFHNTVD